MYVQYLLVVKSEHKLCACNDRRLCFQNKIYQLQCTFPTKNGSEHNSQKAFLSKTQCALGCTCTEHSPSFHVYQTFWWKNILQQMSRLSPSADSNKQMCAHSLSASRWGKKLKSCLSMGCWDQRDMRKNPWRQLWFLVQKSAATEAAKQSVCMPSQIGHFTRRPGFSSLLPRHRHFNKGKNAPRILNAQL